MKPEARHAFLDWTAPLRPDHAVAALIQLADGRYVLAVSDLQLGASADHYYRLSVGDLPVVGSLFRNTARSDQKRELLIFITPRLVQDSVGQR